MKKIKLEIVGLSYSQTQSGAYALVLGEAKGKRRLPIIIGSFEAQAIAIELEKMTPSRPLTHDLFKSLADTFTVSVKEVLIYDFVEGIFFARLVCDNGTIEGEIDARTSDAIALAVRFECPVYTYEFILSQSGIVREDESESIVSEVDNDLSDEEEELLAEVTSGSDYQRKTDKELEDMLSMALEEENYEKASRIRDELNKRKPS